MTPHGSLDLPALLAGETAWLHRLASSLLAGDVTAADVAQDAALLALQRRPDFEGSRWKARGWLRATAQRLVLATRRRSAERTVREERAGREDHQRREDLVREAEARLRVHELLMEAVRSLAEPYRSTVVMRFLEDRSTQEIAQLRGIPAATVRQHVARALRQLREKLARSLGEGQSWRAALAGCVLPAVSSSTAISTLGVLAMNTKAVVVGVALVATLGGVALMLSESEADPVVVEQPLPVAEKVSPPVAVPEQATQPARREVQAVVEAGLRMHVFDTAGHAVPQARVFAWHDDDQHLEARTDDEGQVQFADLSGTGSYLVIGEGYQPVLRKSVKLSGSQRVVVGEGQELHGTVTVDGAVPEEPLTLSFKINASEAVEVPEAIENMLSERQLGVRKQRARTSADGSFVFTGLADGWRGYVEWGWGHRLPRNAPLGRRASENGVSVSVVDAPLRIDLFAYPNAMVRVVWGGTDEPVVRPLANATFILEDGLSSPMVGLRGDDEGMIRVSVPPASDGDLPRFMDPRRRPQIHEMTLHVRHRASGTKTRVVFGKQQIAAGGVLVVRMPREVETWRSFLVVDEQGDPVAGAVLVGKKWSDPTDERGRSRLSVRNADPGELVLAGRGFAFATVDTPDQAGTPDDPWRFVLPRGNRLAIGVRHPDGVVPESLKIAVRYTESPFGPGLQRMTKLQRKLAELDWDGGGTNAERVRWELIKVSPSGVVELLALRTDVSFAVEVHDELGTVIVERDVPALGEREDRSLDLVIPRTGIEREITIVDAAGSELRGANVVLRGERRGTGRVTDGDGVARFPPLYSDDLKMEVSCKGFVRQQLPAPAQARSRVWLRRGVSLTVHVADPDGVPVTSAGLSLRVSQEVSEKGWLRCKAIWAGEYRFDDVPSGEFTLVVRIGADKLTSRHSTDDGVINVRVPRVAKLTIVAPCRSTDEQIRSLYLEPIAGTTTAKESVHAYAKTDGEQLIGQFRCLLPGRYRVFWRDKPEGSANEAPVAEIAVVAGRENRVELPR
ncbi:MAG: sigma-70 family RNA polymerase sigma factor [Planctomycetota bacterium]